MLGYIPYGGARDSAEPRLLEDALGCPVAVASPAATLDIAAHRDLPDPGVVHDVASALKACEWVVAEGIGGFLLAAALRADGFAGAVTFLPYVNPTSWFDVTALAAYSLWRDPRDQVLVGSTPSAAIFRALGIQAGVAEPFGVECRELEPGDEDTAILERLDIGDGPVLLFAGRGQRDKDLHTFVRVAIRAQLLFEDLHVVIASHVLDDRYMAVVRRVANTDRRFHLVTDAARTTLAALYRRATAFATASTSHYETFGRAPAEALAYGTPAIAPRYDGFSEVLSQPGGTLVEVELDGPEPRASESGLLRAVYEVISDPPSASERRTIAQTARARFARPTTLTRLAYLQEPANESTLPNGPCAQLALPDPWRDEIDAIKAVGALGALDHLWRREHHDLLSAFDGEFRRSVRLALAGFPASDLGATSSTNHSGGQSSRR